MSQASFVVYIDESGDEGLNCAGNASSWFVLSAAITRKSRDLETVKVVDTVRELLKRPLKKPLHFRDLRHEHRLPFVSLLAQTHHLRAVSVLVHKPSILEPETFREPHRLYFYAVRHLLERVSWLCRDRRLPGDGDGSAEIIFSNRSGMSYEDLRQYFKLLESGPPNTLDWSVIRCDQMQAFTAGRRMGLQIADAIASGFFKAVEPTHYGHTEDRYVRMLKPIVYHNRGRYAGYGVKIWPREAHGQSALSWLNEHYEQRQPPLRLVREGP